MSLGGVDTVWFWTGDMDRAVAFYADTLGLPLVRRDGEEWAEFDGGPVRLALHGTTDGREASPGGTVVFRVDDLEGARASLEARGVRFAEHVGETPFARFATFEDPDGNAVQIIEHRSEG